MAECLPDHGRLVVSSLADYVFDTDPFWIAALHTVGDVQRATLACAGAAQQALIPTAGANSSQMTRQCSWTCRPPSKPVARRKMCTATNILLPYTFTA